MRYSNPDPGQEKWPNMWGDFAETDYYITGDRFQFACSVIRRISFSFSLFFSSFIREAKEESCLVLRQSMYALNNIPEKRMMLHLETGAPLL